MGIVHHSRYLPYLEEARVEYLRHLGHPYTRGATKGVDAAVLEAYVSTARPLRFDDVVDVHLQLAAVTRTTFQMAYLLTRRRRRGGDRGDGARRRHVRRPPDPPARVARRRWAPVTRRHGSSADPRPS